jgi:hypothetical protein
VLFWDILRYHKKNSDNRTVCSQVHKDETTTAYLSHGFVMLFKEGTGVGELRMSVSFRHFYRCRESRANCN